MDIKNIESYDSILDIPHIITNMKPGDLIILWQPFNDYFLSSNFMKKVDSHEFEYVYSIFFNRDSYIDDKSKKDFLGCFISEWKKLTIGHKEQWGRFINNSDFWNSFNDITHVIKTIPIGDNNKTIEHITESNTDTKTVEKGCDRQCDNFSEVNSSNITKNVFRRVGNSWEIIFNNKRIVLKTSNNGFKYIHKILSSKNPLPAYEICRGEAAQKCAYINISDSDKRIDIYSDNANIEVIDEVIEKIKSRIKELKSIEFTSSLEDQELDELEIKYQKGIESKRELSKDINRNQEFRNCRNIVANSIDRALKKLGEDDTVDLKDLINLLKSARECHNTFFSFNSSVHIEDWILD